MERPDFSWRAKLLFDNTRSEITELNVPAFTYGVGGQGLGTVFYAREGEKVGDFLRCGLRHRLLQPSCRRVLRRLRREQ